MWQNYIHASTVEEAVQALGQYGERARVVAGATDLILELERGARQGVDTLVDVTRIPGLKEITRSDGWVELGALVTHNHCVASPVVRAYGFPLAQAAWQVGSPQIRNRGTVVGNLVTASPANDTIPPLAALGAELVVRSGHGQRTIPLSEFYTGVRRTTLQPDELVLAIRFPELREHQRGMFIKFALRRAQAISLVNTAVVLTLDSGGRVERAAITLGAVAPTIVHAAEAEQALVGQALDAGAIAQAAELAMRAARPISDVRSSAGYRKVMTRVVVRRALQAIADGQEQADFPEQPVLLRTPQPETGLQRPAGRHAADEPITARVNGEVRAFTGGHEKTLLRLLREDGLLTGTKEGCAEGECGACTIYLDGEAVMACLVPAPRAQGADIVTVEGLSGEGALHPVQAAFVEAGAVQCGYCTPGFVMSAAKLLEEQPAPSREQIRQAMTGNLCRCTGYYKIIDAVERAARGAHEPV